MTAARTVPTVSEDHLLRAVLDLCQLLHVRTAHFRPALTGRGWRTAVQGDGKGWPDLVMVGPGGILYRELKATGRRLAPEQVVWAACLQAAGGDVGVWTPADLHAGRVEAQLREICRAAL